MSFQTHFIKFHSKGAARIIELDRPSALHALNLEMIEALITALTVRLLLLIHYYGNFFNHSHGKIMIIAS